MSRLASCPSCEEAVRMVYSKQTEIVDGETVKETIKYRIYCPLCGCGTNWKDSAGKAAGAWNALAKRGTE